MNLEQQVEQLLSQQSYPVIKKTEEYQKMTSEILLSLGVKEDSQFYHLYVGNRSVVYIFEICLLLFFA